MKKLFKKMKKERGDIALIAVFASFIFILLMAFVVDGGLMYYKATKLQNAVDATTIAITHNIGDDDTALQENTEKFLELNGFDPKDYGPVVVTPSGDNSRIDFDYGNKNMLVTIEKKGMLTEEAAADNEDYYITAGYVRLTVEIKNRGLFNSLSNIEALKLKKSGSAKCDMQYVKMPESLNYTIFGNSTKEASKYKDMTVQINGRTNNAQAIGNVFENLINGINEKIVQPIIGIFGGDTNYNKLVSVSTSHAITNGDVHSNSDINIGVNTLQASRTKDADYDGKDDECTCQSKCSHDAINTYCFACGADYTKCEGDTPSELDYNQVTYTAVGNIYFSNGVEVDNSFTGRLFGLSTDKNTKVYVQNQQYLERTQLALKIINTINFDEIHTGTALKSAYTTAAVRYLKAQATVTDSQKDAVMAQVDNLEYLGPNSFRLNNQKSIVYNVTDGTANGVLDRIDNGETLSDFLADVEGAGIDPIATSASKSSYDTGSTMETYNVVFTKVSGGSSATMQVANVDVTNRNIYYMQKNNALTPSAEAGYSFAVAKTFRQQSDFVQAPNMKPYFTRAINRSVRNATTTKSSDSSTDGVSDSAVSVKSATANTQEALEKTIDSEKTLLVNKGTTVGVDAHEQSSYKDDKYATSESVISQDTTPLFRQTLRPTGSDANTIDPNQLSLTRYGNNDEGHTKYKGETLFKDNGEGTNVLKTPIDYISEYKENNDAKYGKDGVLSYKSSKIDGKYGSSKVANAKTDIINTKSYTGKKNVVNGWSFATEAPDEKSVFLRDTLSSSPKDALLQKIANKPTAAATLPGSADMTSGELTIAKPSTSKGYAYTSTNPAIMKLANDKWHADAHTFTANDVLYGSYTAKYIIEQSYTVIQQAYNNWKNDTSGKKNYDWINDREKNFWGTVQWANFDWANADGGWNGTNGNYWRPSSYKHLYGQNFHDTKNNRGLVLFPTNDASGGKDALRLTQNIACTDRSIILGQGCGLMVEGGATYNNNALYTKNSIEFRHNTNDVADGSNYDKAYVVVNGRAEVGNILLNDNTHGVVIVNGDLIINKADGYYIKFGNNSDLILVVTGNLVFKDATSFEIPSNLMIISNEFNYNVTNNGTLYLDAFNHSDKTITNNGTLRVSKSLTCASLTNSAAGKVYVGAVLTTGNFQNSGAAKIDGSIQCSGNITNDNANAVIQTRAINADNIYLSYGAIRGAGKITVGNQLILNNGAYLYANEILTQTLSQFGGSVVMVDTGNASVKGNITVKDKYEIFSSTLWVENGDVSVTKDFDIKYASLVYINGDVFCDMTITVDGSKFKIVNDVTASSLNTLNDSQCQWNELHVNDLWENASTSRVYCNKSLATYRIINHGTIYVEPTSIVEKTVKIVSLYNDAGAVFVVNGDLQVTAQNLQAGLTETSIYNKGEIYVDGDLTTAYGIDVDGGKLYVKGSVSAFNDTSSVNKMAIYSHGEDSQIYIAGVVSSKGSGRSIIVNGTGENTVFSVYGESALLVATSSLHASITSFDVQQQNASIYLGTGKTTEILYGTVFLPNCTSFVNNGRMYVYGGLRVNCDASFGGTGAKTIISGNLTLDGKSLEVKGDHKMIVFGQIAIKEITTKQDSEVYAVKKLVKLDGGAESTFTTFIISDNSLLYCGPNTETTNYSVVSVINESDSSNFCGSLYYPGEGKTYSLSSAQTFKGGTFATDAGLILNSNITLKKNDSGKLSCVYVGGDATLNSFNFANEGGELYLMGKVKISSSAQQFKFNSGCVNYIGPLVIDGSETRRLTYVGAFNCGGTNYIDNDVVANTDNNAPNKDSDKMVGNRWTSIYISDGATHISGNLTIQNKNRGTYVKENATLSCNNFSTYSTIYDYGKFVILGNMSYTNTDEFSDRAAGKDMKEGISLKIGKDENVTGAMMFIGGTQDITIGGYFLNYGDFYCNANFFGIMGHKVAYGWVDGSGQNEEYDINTIIGQSSKDIYARHANNKAEYAPHMSIKATDRSKTYFSGNVSMYAGLYTGTNAVFTAEGDFKYGQIILNGGVFYVKGAIGYSNNCYSIYHVELFWSTDSEKKGSYSIINGFKNGGELNAKNNDAVFFVGSGLTVGTSRNYKSDNEKNCGGSIQNFGSMYVNGDLNVYSCKELAINIIAFAGDTGSKTFVNGNCWNSGGFITNRDSMFMCEGDLEAKRCARIGGIADWDETLANDGCYLYVGGNMLTSTAGKTSNGNIGLTDSTWNYFTVFSNSNCYIGGAFFTNSIFVPKRNVTFVVDGQNKGKIQVYNDFLSYVETKLTEFSLKIQGYDPDKIKFVVVGDSSINGFEDNGNHGQLYTFVIHGSAYIEETFRYRDMSKMYCYGDFYCASTNNSRNIEIGKSLTSDAADDTWAKIGTFRTAGDSDARYDYANATYFYVQDQFRSRGRLNTYAGTTMKIGGNCSIANKLQMSHHSNVYVGGDLKVGNFIDGKQYAKLFARGSIDTNRYLLMAERSVTYSGGKIDALTSIEAKSYSTMFARGDIKAQLSTIKIRDRSNVFCAGNMTALNYIELGKYDEKYKDVAADIEKSECKCLKQCTGGNVDSECDLCKEDWHNCFVITPCSCETKCVDKDHKNSSCELCNRDWTQCEIITDSNGCVCTSSCTSNEHKNTSCPVCNTDYRKCEIVKNELGDDETDPAYGGTFYVGKALTSYTGYIKEYGFSSVVVGKYVFANRYLTLRSNADMWVLPEAFNNQTYKKIVKTFESDGSILGNIIAYIAKAAYEVQDALSLKNGSVYSMGELTLNKNASLMGTWDCYSMDQCLLSHDSLVYFGHDFKNYASSIQLDFDSSTPLVGYGSYGAVYTTLQCKNKTAHPHGYTIYTNSYDSMKTYKCDKCGVELSHSTVKENVTCPVVIYANHEIDIITTVDMRLTYMVACNGDVNIADAYSNSDNDTSNLKQLPNAIASYNGAINYKAIYSKICALFYAPLGKVDLDGYYQEIWGCCIGDTVEVNTFYLNMHRFSNWRTMDLQIAEAGNIYLIPDSEFEAAEDNVDDEFMYTKNTADESAGGASLFFDSEIIKGGSGTGAGVDSDNSALGG